MFGLNENDWNLVQRLCITPLKKAGAQVWVFGSRARGDHRPFSDLDLLYSPPSPGVSLSISQMKEAIEESRIGIKIDLVSEDELADSYRARVVHERVKV